MTARKQRPYWLIGGTETCHLCSASYVLEMEYRCVACDRGFCSQCVLVVRETREVFCQECRPFMAEEAG